MKQCKYFSDNIIKFFARTLHRESVLCLRPKICHTKQQLVDRDTDTLSMMHNFALCQYRLRLDVFANYVFSLFHISNKPPLCLHPLGLRELMATTCRSEVSPAHQRFHLQIRGFFWKAFAAGWPLTAVKAFTPTCKPQSPFLITSQCPQQ